VATNRAFLYNAAEGGDYLELTPFEFARSAHGCATVISSQLSPINYIIKINLNGETCLIIAGGEGKLGPHVKYSAEIYRLASNGWDKLPGNESGHTNWSQKSIFYSLQICPYRWWEAP